jgi:hypothetical protein
VSPSRLHQATSITPLFCSIQVISIFANLFGWGGPENLDRERDAVSVRARKCDICVSESTIHRQDTRLADQMQESSFIDDSAKTTSVPADPGQLLLSEHLIAFAYTHDERRAIDAANEAFSPVIDAVNTYEDIDGWVPALVKGVRALRDRAMRDTGALTYQDNEYRKTFGDLLNAEPIGPWLLDKSRHSLLDAVHYLGSEDAYLDAFIDWRAKIITEAQRKRWRNLRTLVDRFKEWQTCFQVRRGWSH